MAVLKSQEEDLFHASLVPMTQDLYVFLRNAVRCQLRKELHFITVERLKSVVRNYIKERNRNGIVCVTPRNTVRLTMFIRDLFFYKDHAVAELHISLPVLGTSSEHEEIWRRLLSGDFPNHGLRDGDLCVFVDLVGSNLPEKANGVFRRKSNK